MIVLIQETFDFQLAFADAVSLIPVKLCSADILVWQTNRGNAFQFPPAFAAVLFL
jgi:hypothetical protein